MCLTVTTDFPKIVDLIELRTTNLQSGVFFFWGKGRGREREETNKKGGGPYHRLAPLQKQ